MEFAKFGKEIKSISEIEVMDFVVENRKNRVVVVNRNYYPESPSVSTRYYDQNGEIKYSFIAECDLEDCRYATLEEYNNFVNGMEELGIEFTYDYQFMASTKMVEERKKEDRFLRSNKIAATFMYIVCVLAVLVNASDFGLLGCIEFLSSISTMYTDQIKTIMSGKPIWETRPSTLYNHGGAISTFTALISILAMFVEYCMNVEGKKSLKGFASYASEKWLLGGNM